MGANEQDDRASCHLCLWEYSGLHAKEHFARHMDEHVERESRYRAPRLTDKDKDFLRTNRIKPEDWE